MLVAFGSTTFFLEAFCCLALGAKVALSPRLDLTELISVIMVPGEQGVSLSVVDVIGDFFIDLPSLLQGRGIRIQGCCCYRRKSPTHKDSTSDSPLINRGSANKPQGAKPHPAHRNRRRGEGCNRF